MNKLNPLGLKTTFIALFYLATVSVEARASDNGRDEAYHVCQSMSFQSDVIACIQFVNATPYFQTDVIPVCVTYTFDQEKFTCLRAIANKVYAAYEVKTCSELTFTSEQMKCFLRLGLPYYIVSLNEISLVLDRARFEIKLGNVQNADLLLKKLQRRLAGLP